MDDNQQQVIFNQLHTLANEIAARIKNDLDAKIEELQGVRAERDRTLDQLHEKDKQLADLSDRNAELTASNKTLSAALQTSQYNLLQAKMEIKNLRDKLSQIQSLAGDSRG